MEWVFRTFGSHRHITPTMSKTIYDYLLSGAMELNGVVPVKWKTPSGKSFAPQENPRVVQLIGSDLFLFADWCEYWCSWRRRCFLVVVEELTRIIHKEFPEAHIEVGLSANRDSSFMDHRAQN